MRLLSHSWRNVNKSQEPNLVDDNKPDLNSSNSNTNMEELLNQSIQGKDVTMYDLLYGEGMSKDLPLYDWENQEFTTIYTLITH